MDVYYSQAEYEQGKHKILKIWAEFIGLKQPNLAKLPPYNTLSLDEYFNRKLANRLYYNDRSYDELPDLFYVDNSGNIRDNSDDSIVTIELNPQKVAYKLSQLYGLTQEQVENYIENNITNLATAKDFLKKLSAVVLWLVKQTKLDE